MDWVKERDALIAQTAAFVQSVTGRKPDFAAAPIQIAAAENSAVFESPDAAEHPVALKAADLADQSGTGLPNWAFAQSDVRKEVENRVAAFQAHQHRFQQDRDVYFNSVLAKARADIGKSADTPTTLSTTDHAGREASRR